LEQSLQLLHALCTQLTGVGARRRLSLKQKFAVLLRLSVNVAQVLHDPV
jgi:hypothetical protein